MYELPKNTKFKSPFHFFTEVAGETTLESLIKKANEDKKLQEAFISKLTENNIHVRSDTLREFFLKLKFIIQRDNPQCVFAAFIADRGTVHDFLEKLRMKNKPIIILENLRLIAKHALKALGALHRSGRVHGDFHTRNIFAYTKTNQLIPSKKIKYLLGDISQSFEIDPNDKKYTPEYEIEALGHSVLIPLFWQYYAGKEALCCCDEKNFSLIPQIKNMLKKTDELFPAFLKKLQDGKFKTAKDALRDPFITTPFKVDNDLK